MVTRVRSEWAGGNHLKWRPRPSKMYGVFSLLLSLIAKPLRS